MATRSNAQASLEIKFHAATAVPKSGAVIAVPVRKGGSLIPAAAALDAALGKTLSAAAKTKNLKGAAGEVLEVFLAEDAPAARVFLYGATQPQSFADKEPRAEGKNRPLKPPPAEAPLSLQLAGEKAGATLSAALDAAKVDEVWIFATDVGAGLAVAEGLLLRSWRFDRYFTRGRKHNAPRLKQAHIVLAKGNAGDATRQFAKREAVAHGVFLARHLVSEPPNKLYPESFAETASKALTPLGVKVSTLNVAQMEKLGMGALLGVAQGSVKPPRLLIMEWNGGAKGKAPVALVGKGVCFDTGGISLKPAGGMEDMKYDMAGAGAVTGAMAAVAGRKAKANVVGICALVENMPDGNAQRPSDIVTSASGQTIEVLNTDAEGRLVLADALWYAQTKFNPAAIVDLATLTGAVVVALGHLYGGCYANQAKLQKALCAVGGEVQEDMWPLPLDPHYDRQIDSRAADMQNIGNIGGAGGSITAAQFLQRFVEADTPWAHLDIAAVAWQKRQFRPQAAVGATGFGVRLLDAWIARDHEK